MFSSIPALKRKLSESSSDDESDLIITKVVKAPRRLLAKDDEPSEPEYIMSGSESPEPEYISSESEVDRERNRVLDSLEA